MFILKLSFNISTLHTRDEIILSLSKIIILNAIIETMHESVTDTVRLNCVGLKILVEKEGPAKVKEFSTKWIVVRYKMIPFWLRLGFKLLKEEEIEAARAG